MSGEYCRLLWYRAERFLVRALRDYSEGDYDGACFNAEEAVQLAVKAVLYKYFGEAPRIHGSRTLLSMLRNLFMGAGRDDLASLIGRFTADNSDTLDLLEESYIMARYGSISYGRRQADLCIEAARRAFEVLKDVERKLA
ncbi:MAG: HEPN domain-containing protein [Nitrososphaerota archaeon]|nr:HEPN domain-containing protein [Candidatus Bathyarchaeota archaeon]MDW8061695.1 HEPN domain-containing protein [Nitrososphaerota archaeon]